MFAERNTAMEGIQNVFLSNLFAHARLKAYYFAIVIFTAPIAWNANPKAAVS